MSTTISFDVIINGAPADADSAPIFSDSAGTNGVIRTDTGASVVSVGTALTSLGTGSGKYQYAFDDPVPGLTYRYWVTFVINGSTYVYAGITNGSPAAPVVDSGHYSSRGALEDEFGIQNIAQWADKENAGNPDIIARVIESALQWADDEINNNFADSRYATPFNPVPSRVEDWATIFAANKLYRGRGLAEDDLMGGKLVKLMKEARLNMMMFVTGSMSFAKAQRQTVKAPRGPVVSVVEPPATAEELSAVEILITGRHWTN